MKLKKDCPCANRVCPHWGKCKECRVAMANENQKPVCEWER